jgi:glycogen(starch) synthase
MTSDPQRILMTVDAVGGVWTYALDLARALVESNVHVVLATMGPPPSSAQRQAAASVPNVELITSTFALEWMDDPWADVGRAGDWLLELEARLRPDVVHLNGFAHGVLPFHAPVVVVGHSCVLSWADAIPGAIDPRKRTAYFERVAAGVRGAEVVVAPSQAMLSALARHYGPLAHPIVIHNGRRSDLFMPQRKEPFIFTAGRLWDRAKNVEAVAAVAPRLPWPTAVAGADGIDSVGARLVLPGVRQLGTLDESTMAGWLGRASIFALPARYEPFGLLPLEAALSGCALVLGDIPSLREIWGDAAAFVPPDDRGALVRATASLIAAPRLLMSRADAAHAHAARYSLDAMGTGYLAAYRSAIQNRTAREAWSCAS